jgi:mannan endo-1,4-beta-mannosidase
MKSQASILVHFLALLARGSTLALTAACGTQYVDPIVGSPPDAALDIEKDAHAEPRDVAGADKPTREIDDAAIAVDADASSTSEACSRWLTASDCSTDSAHGCAFQPNAVGCHAADPTCAAGTCMTGDPFVRRSGATLWLHGAPFSFLGAVSWGIAGTTGTCRVSSFSTQEDALIRSFDDMVDMRASAFRIWAFQSYAGPSGRDYSSFDRVVSYARRAGVRLIMVLENNWADCTEGGQRNDAWFAAGYRAPYGSYALSLSDYAQGLVSHFRDEPTILAWEIMHEATADDFNALDAFAQDMSSVIRSADPNHLISLGAENGTAPGTSNADDPSNYQKLHDHPNIDIIDVHDLNAPDVALPTTMSRDAAIAAALGKPIFAGASAVALAGTSPDDFAARGDAVTRKLSSAFAAGYVGFLIYDYYPEWSSAGWEFDGRSGEPLAGLTGLLGKNARQNQ